MTKTKSSDVIWHYTDKNVLYGKCPYCGGNQIEYVTDSFINRYDLATDSIIKYCKKCQMRIETFFEEK